MGYTWGMKNEATSEQVKRWESILARWKAECVTLEVERDKFRDQVDTLVRDGLTGMDEPQLRALFGDDKFEAGAAAGKKAVECALLLVERDDLQAQLSQVQAERDKGRVDRVNLAHEVGELRAERDKLAEHLKAEQADRLNGDAIFRAINRELRDERDKLKEEKGELLEACEDLVEDMHDCVSPGTKASLRILIARCTPIEGPTS